MVRGDWGDRRRLAYQAQEVEAQEAQVLEAQVLEAEVLEAQVLEVEARSAQALEVEVVEAQALEAVRGQCQNRQIQEEGGVLRARTASFPKIALAALRLTIRI